MKMHKSPAKCSAVGISVVNILHSLIIFVSF